MHITLAVHLPLYRATTIIIRCILYYYIVCNNHEKISYSNKYQRVPALNEHCTFIFYTLQSV